MPVDPVKAVMDRLPRPTTALPPAIVAAAQRGWRLHPLRPKDKLPLLKEWQRRAASELYQIEAWAREHPGCNWGAVCGPESGLFAVDVDDPDAMQRLENDHGPVPEGLCNVTSRGYQLLYAWPSDRDARPATNCPCAGIDVRGRDSYIVIPPSVHPSGHVYHYSDDSLPLPACPVWLLDLITTRKQASAGTRQSATASPPATVTSIQQGSRTPLITKLVGKLHSEGVPEAGILQAALALNETFEPPLPESKVTKTVKDMCRRYEPGEQPKGKPEPEVWTPNVIQLSTVEARAVKWLAKPYFPLGMLSCVDGHPGTGKSFLTMKIASEGSRGKMLDGRIGDPWSTLYLTCENPKHEVMRPRFEGMGADLTKIFLLEGQTSTVDGEEMTTAVTLASIPAIEAAIVRTGCLLLVVDPWQSFLGSGVDMNRANETRPIMDALAALAEKYGIAILILRHLSKAGGTHAVSRALGSIDVSGAVRSVVLVGSLPDDPQARALVHIKTNIGPFGDALGFMIDAEGKFAWTGASTITAADMLSNPEPSKGDTSKDRAEEWLSEKLRAGSVEQREIREQAEAAGISYRTLVRAKAALRVESRKASYGSGWLWWLPGNEQGSEAVQ